ncbi:MFS transporter [Lactobacillus psittaci]|uniref:Transporter, major facilitator family n=1 Tax=Lactobacillus psittaci DSM 15354 TaxID=1122152 RepID=A0A0R1SDM7_9LACO|nr:MFS transporter [Lactobacillus psittaci]KRL63323.1 transporter, major facilitator family [Lactobacillus psittaci DSM 15354]
MKYNKNSLLFRVSLLSISFLLLIAPAVSAVLPLMIPVFKNVSRVNIESLVTVPNFGIVFGLIVSPFLVKLLDKKKTVIIGLIIFLLGGTFPMYATNFNLIVISRIILGFGIGLFNSLAFSLIAQFYDSDEERATMLGFQNMIGGLGSAFASFVLSWLITISWHMAFAVYLLAIPVLILFALVIPDDKVVEHVTKETETKSKENQKLNPKLYAIWLCFFLFFMFYVSNSYKVPQLVTSERLGNMSQYSAMMGITVLCRLPLGAAFGIIFKKLHKLVLPVGLSMMVISFWCYSFAQSMAMIFIGALILSFAIPMVIPYFYNWISWTASKENVNIATTVALVGINLASTASPFVVNFLTHLMGNTTPRAALLLASGVLLAIAIYAVIEFMHDKKQA